MRLFLRYGAFNMTFVHRKCILHIYYFCMFLSIIFYPNKSSDQLQAYSMLDRHIKKYRLSQVKFKFTTKNKKIDLSAFKESFLWNYKITMQYKNVDIRLHVNILIICRVERNKSHVSITMLNDKLCAEKKQMLQNVNAVNVSNNERYHLH